MNEDSPRPQQTFDEIAGLLDGVDVAPASAEKYAGPKKSQKTYWWTRIASWRPTTSDLDLAARGAVLDHSLKRAFGWTIFVVAMLQVGAANCFMFFHAAWGFGKGVSDVVIVGWFTATVVESVGLMAIVTTYLFTRGKTDAA